MLSIRLSLYRETLEESSQVLRVSSLKQVSIIIAEWYLVKPP